MTYEEAIKKIDFLIDGYQMLIDENIGNGDVVGHDVRGTWQSETSCIDAYKDLINACETAKQALEKQMPKNPITIRYPFSLCCPICNSPVGFYSDFLTDSEICKLKYCAACGQALDWGDER